MQLFIISVWCSLAVFREWRQTNVRNKRKIFCLVPRFLRFLLCERGFSCCFRTNFQDTRARNDMREKFFDWSSAKDKADEEKCQLSKRMALWMRWLDDARQQKIFMTKMPTMPWDYIRSSWLPFWLRSLYQSIEMRRTSWCVSHITGVATRHEITQTSDRSFMRYACYAIQLVVYLFSHCSFQVREALVTFPWHIKNIKNHFQSE